MKQVFRLTLMSVLLVAAMVSCKSGGATSSAEAVSDSTPPEYVSDEQALMDLRKEQAVGSSEVTLLIEDYEGHRQVRSGETNTGNLFCDALRYFVHADISLVGGGVIRTNIPSGTITYNDIAKLFPFNNYVYKVEVTGEDILGVLEFGTRTTGGGESGDFPQCSGISYTVHTSDHRLTDVVILRPDGSREPLEPEKTYTLATLDYCVDGGFHNLLMNCPILEKTETLASDAVYYYIREHLDGVIDSSYAIPQGRIHVVD